MPRALAVVIATLLIACASINRPDPVDPAVEVRAEPAVDAPSARGSLRVVTYNVHGEPARAIARGLASSRWLDGADVVLLQEIEHRPAEGDSAAGQLADQLDMAYAYAPGYGRDDGGSHGVAVLSRYPMSDVEVIELPRYSVHFNSARRVALGATLTVGDARVRVYSVHLDNRVNPSDRIEQLSPVVRHANRQHVDRVVIAGDVNTSPFCWLTHVIPVPCGQQTRRLDRFVRRYGFDTPVAAAGATSKWLTMRLDAIYTRGLGIIDYGVDRTVRLSDHLPVWLDVRL